MRKIITSFITVILFFSIFLVLPALVHSQDYEFVLKWGSFGSGEGEFNEPDGIAVDSEGNVYVAEYYNHRIQKFDSNGEFLGWWGLDNTGFTGWHDPGTGTTAVGGHGDGQLWYLRGLAVGSVGNVYVTEDGNHRIQKFDSSGNFITKWGSFGSGDSQFHEPWGIAVDSYDNVYVVDRILYRIQKFDSDGNFITKWGSFGSGDGQFDQPYGVAVDSEGNVYVADGNNQRIQKFDSDGNFITKWGSFGYEDGQLYYPGYMVVDSEDNVYVADCGNRRIQKFDSSGNFITKWGSFGYEDGQFEYPFGVAIDSEGNVYVTDIRSHQIQKFIPPYIAVSIDIKPFSRKNVIRLSKWGIVSVAILSAADFDATNDIDMSSITFGKTGVEDSLAYYHRWLHWDVDGDGLRDQVCYFWIRKTGFEVGDEVGFLKGQTNDGVPIQGSDMVEIKEGW